jgi:4-amino-4-deoxy-L-arabinose transferase-like glycosyltransferase
MNPLPFLASYHAHHAGGWTNWLAHMTISAVIHALIYGLVFRLMRHMTMGEAAVLVVLVLGCLFMWSRARDRRGW